MRKERGQALHKQQQRGAKTIKQARKAQAHKEEGQKDNQHQKQTTAQPQAQARATKSCKEEGERDTHPSFPCRLASASAILGRGVHEARHLDLELLVLLAKLHVLQATEEHDTQLNTHAKKHTQQSTQGQRRCQKEQPHGRAPRSALSTRCGPQ